MRFVLSKAFIVFFMFVCVGCAGGGLEKGGHVRHIGLIPSATLIYSQDYKVIGRAEGESSTLLFLGILPLTKHLDIEYALSQAVQKVQGGQSMANIQVWHETHYYFPIGAVSVVKVEGDVISFTQIETPIFQTPTPETGGGIKVGGKKKKKAGGKK